MLLGQSQGKLAGVLMTVIDGNHFHDCSTEIHLAPDRWLDCAPAGIVRKQGKGNGSFVRDLA